MKTELKADVESFTLLSLLRKALEYKGLKLQEGASKAYSKPIKTYKLNDKLLTLLSEKGIKRQNRPDCNNQIFTLVDENPQKAEPGWSPSNYWNFQLVKGVASRFDLHISLSAGLYVSHEKRGIIFWPLAQGTFVSPCDLLPNLRMFKALTDSDENAPAIAKELAASGGNIVVTWNDLGLGGLRSLENLFAEFAGQNKKIDELSRNDRIFDPIPYPQHQQPGDELFIAEPAQPKVFKRWQEQLKEYRVQLIR